MIWKSPLAYFTRPISPGIYHAGTFSVTPLRSGLRVGTCVRSAYTWCPITGVVGGELTAGPRVRGGGGYSVLWIRI